MPCAINVGKFNASLAGIDSDDSPNLGDVEGAGAINNFTLS
jgi:hypothetical protein